MTLAGIGIDIASVTRFRALLDRYGARLQDRWFDPHELLQPGSRELNLARSYAVKEAVWKALHHERAGPLRWREIVTQPEGARRFHVRLQGILAEQARAHGISTVVATASVMDDFVIAVAIAERS